MEVAVEVADEEVFEVAEEEVDLEEEGTVEEADMVVEDMMEVRLKYTLTHLSCHFFFLLNILQVVMVGRFHSFPPSLSGRHLESWGDSHTRRQGCQ